MFTDNKYVAALCKTFSGTKWDKIVLFALTVLTKIKRVSDEEWKKIDEHNKLAIARSNGSFFTQAADGRKYIERQREAGKSGLALWYGYRGKEKSRTAIYADYNLCEVIATANTLSYFGERVSVGEIATEIGRTGICLGGEFGTAPSAVVRFLRKRGYRIKQYMGEELKSADWLKLQRENDTFIAFCYNDHASLLGGIHTMSLTPKDGKKAYLIHNDYKTYGNRSFASLKAALESYDNGRVLLLIGITRH